jgi:hypothetical protein
MRRQYRTYPPVLQFLARIRHDRGPRPRLPDSGASLAVWSKRRPWRARIYFDGKERSLGYFATREEARAAHAQAVRAHLGEVYLKGHGYCHE